MKFLRVLICWCVSVGALASCSGTGSRDETANDSASSKKTCETFNYHLPENGTLAAFYVMNNFSGGSPGTVQLYSWLHPFLDSIGKRGYSQKDELFTNNGGGVMNAQLNPAADILLIGFFDEKPDTGSVLYTVNDFPIQSEASGVERMAGKELYMCWCILSQANWNYMRHPASDKEVDSVCVKRNMKREDWVKNSCTVLRLAVSTSSKGVKHRTENYLLLQFS